MAGERNPAPTFPPAPGEAANREHGSSVITKGNEALSNPGFCRSESMFRRYSARICASRATIPGWSRTKNRKYHGVSKSLLMVGVETLLAISPLSRAKLSATNITSDTTATAVGSPPAPAPRNAMSPPYCPEVSTRFRLRCTRPNGESAGTRHGPTSANSVSPFNSAREIWRMVQPLASHNRNPRHPRSESCERESIPAPPAYAIPRAREWPALPAHRRHRDPPMHPPRHSLAPAPLPAPR